MPATSSSRRPALRRSSSARSPGSSREAAFPGLDPEQAQHEMPVAGYVEVLADLKPRFIHHPSRRSSSATSCRSTAAISSSTYFDVPRLRTLDERRLPDVGIAYAWHPHRDTWYSAPMRQLNYWMPVYAIEAGNTMAFHPHYFDVAVPNSSADYNYYEWNAKYRAAAATNVETDTRPLPARRSRSTSATRSSSCPRSAG